MPPNSQPNADSQPSWWEPVQKFLDNKLINFGIPGIFIGIAADHARNGRWRFALIFLGLSGLMSGLFQSLERKNRL